MKTDGKKIRFEDINENDCEIYQNNNCSVPHGAYLFVSRDTEPGVALDRNLAAKLAKVLKHWSKTGELLTPKTIKAAERADKLKESTHR